MIKAKFIKAYPTEDGITYMLKGEKSKQALRLAADLQDEDCLLSLALEREAETEHQALKHLVDNFVRDLSAILDSKTPTAVGMEE